MVIFKPCAGCSFSKPIYKNISGKKYCRDCARRLQPPKRIAPRGTKRIASDRIYFNRAYKFKQLHPICEVRLQGCSHITTDVHHLYSGMDRSKYMLDESTWLGVCRNCHTNLHDNFSSDELVEMGLKRIDHSKQSN